MKQVDPIVAREAVARITNRERDFNTAKRGAVASLWFSEFAEGKSVEEVAEPPRLIPSQTANADAAKHYMRQAFVEAFPALLSKAIELAQADMRSEPKIERKSLE